jgi:hypothetical protein
VNPADLARKIEAVIVDYDINTAMTALEIAKLLIRHRKLTEVDFSLSQFAEQSDSDNSR